MHNSPFEVCNVLICYNVYPEIKRIIKLAENKTKKNINRLTNTKICILEFQLIYGCAFKVSSVTGPLGY